MHQPTRSLRPIRILKMLRSGSRFTLASLAESFAVSERTAQRDLLLLRKAGVGVDYDPSTRTYGIAASSECLPERSRSEPARLLAAAARSSPLYRAAPQRTEIESAIALLLGDHIVETPRDTDVPGPQDSERTLRSDLAEAIRIAIASGRSLRTRISDPRTGWEWRLTLAPLRIVQDRGRTALLARSAHQESLFLVDVATIVTAAVDEELGSFDAPFAAVENVERLF